MADAGPDQEVTLGTVVTLDGTGSSDPDGDELTYRWSIFTAPEGSVAALSDPTAPKPTFQPDVCGEYVISLVVTDTAGAESPEDSVTINVVCADLGMTLTDAPDPVRRGEQLTYTATVRNDGPDDAQDMAMTLSLTGSAVLVAIQGVNPDTDCTITYTGSSSFRTLSSLTCARGDLASGAQRTLTVTVQPTTAGTLSATASAEADSPEDPEAANNTVTATTTVTKGK